MIEKIRVTRSDNDLATKTLEAINKINELVDAVNNIVSVQEKFVDAVNSIVSVQEKLIDSRFVVETENNQNAFTKSMVMDKEFAEEEMEHLQKENSNLKDEVKLLQKQLEIAIQGIKTLGEYDPYKESQSIDTIAQDIIEQITALEQKDVK